MLVALAIKMHICILLYLTDQTVMEYNVILCDPIFLKYVIEYFQFR